MKIHKEDNYLIQLKELIIGDFKNDAVKIILFGSRARKDNFIASDVDIGVIPYGKLDETKMALLKEKIENLNIPYKVEIVNFQHVSEDFKKLAMRDAITWKD